MFCDGHEAALQLVETGALVDFEIVEVKLDPGPDEGEFGVCIELVLDSHAADEMGDVVEWGAFGFLYTLGMLSYVDARPRGRAGERSGDEDGFRMSDFFDGLAFVRGELQFRAHYIRDRRIETAVIVRPDGSATLATWGRGKAALRWLDMLKGETPLKLVQTTSEPDSAA